MHFNTIIIITFMFAVSFNNGRCNAENDSIARAEELKELFIEAISESPESNEKKMMLIKAFPNSFKEFLSLYGYFENKSIDEAAAPLYDYHMEHLNYFLYKLQVNKDAKISKLVNISIGGHWDADAVSVLQGYIRRHIKIDALLKFIKEKSHDEIFSFWYFFFDGPHPDNYEDDYKLMYSRCKELDPQIAELMKQAYEKLLLEHDGHGH